LQLNQNNQLILKGKNFLPRSAAKDGSRNKIKNPCQKYIPARCSMWFFFRPPHDVAVIRNQESGSPSLRAPGFFAISTKKYPALPVLFG
jgi:hypothetical protein